MSPALVIHGGTGQRPDRRRIAQIRKSLWAVCDEASRYLHSHSAPDTVVFAVRRLEDDPLFNAGTGSTLQRDGKARMSASVMDGARVRFAAVLNIERVRNPVLVARALLERRDRILAGPGATRFARSLKFPSWNPVTEARKRQWRACLRLSEAGRQAQRIGKFGTVGAVALDREGRLAAATSTGGRGFEWPGRVSDSGLPVGNYANDRVALSCTGLGEEIVDEGLAVRIAQRTADGMSLNRAFGVTFAELRRRHRHAGAIAADRRGRIACATTLPVLFAVSFGPRGRLETF